MMYIKIIRSYLKITLLVLNIIFFVSQILTDFLEYIRLENKKHSNYENEAKYLNNKIKLLRQNN